MQTSLARRQQRRLNGGRRRGGGGAARRAAVALPLFLFGSLAILALLGFAAVVGAYAYYSQGLPDPLALDNLVFNQQSTITDRTGKVVLATFGSQRREVVTFDELPPSILDATTAIEDKTFWTNTGFDPLGIISAAIDTLRGNERGASTITQQLVRARLLDPALVQDPNRRVERKIKEIIQSIRVTEAFPGVAGKQRIITDYLNQNFYGDNDYGIKAAAEDYFGVSDLSKLTLAQAAILAGIPQSPTQYDLVRNAVAQPDGTLLVPADTAIVQRRNDILNLMEGGGRTPISGTTYTNADFAAAKAEPVILAPRITPQWKAPQFVWAVRDELTNLLCGPGATTCPALERGGLTVRTTLDWRLQQIAEKWVKAAAVVPNSRNPQATAKALGLPYQSWMAHLRGKQVSNGALVATDYQTGEVLAYVGSADYYAKNATAKFQPQFDVIGDGWRQVGSTFKPFNYVTGINDKTMTAATMFMDVTTDFGNKYIPTDADNLERGPVRMRQALQFSLNIPAVKALYYNGVDHIFQMAEAFGMRFQTQTPTAGLSLTLGTQEVRPIDFITAWGTLADGGHYIGTTKILSITDANGQNLVTPYTVPAGNQVVSPQAAYIVTNMLEGNTDPRINPIWGGVGKIVSSSGQRRPATLKTGTNNDAKDLNAYGYLAPPDAKGRANGEYALAAGAWNGNSDNSVVASRTNPVFSLDVSAHVWQGFMQEVSAKWAVHDFTEPPGIVTAPVDAFSGMKPGPYTTKTVNELFLAGTQPTQVDTLKTGVQIEQETNTLWQNGCYGTPITKGYLDFSQVETAVPAWHQQDLAWAARAAKGVGVGGNPGKIRTYTSYFYEYYSGAFKPYGATWGAPFAPKATCSTAPPPSPSPSFCIPDPLGPPCPSLPPSPTPAPSPSPSGPGKKP